MFDIHPNEFIDESNEEREFEKRASNPVASFLQDTLRSKLKTKNLGIDGAKIYEREIKYFSSKNKSFITLKDYCNILDI